MFFPSIHYKTIKIQITGDLLGIPFLLLFLRLFFLHFLRTPSRICLRSTMIEVNFSILARTSLLDFSMAHGVRSSLHSTNCLKFEVDAPPIILACNQTFNISYKIHKLIYFFFLQLKTLLLLLTAMSKTPHAWLLVSQTITLKIKD